MIEVGTCLSHSYAPHCLSHSYHEQTCNYGEVIDEASLPVWKDERGDGDLEHGAQMGDIVLHAIAEKEKARNFGVGGVPVCGGVEFEEVKEGECRDELWQSPDPVVVEG